MQVVTSEQGCVSIITLTGRIDATTASSFETSCRELLDSGAKKVVVDLGGCRIHQFRRVTGYFDDG